MLDCEREPSSSLYRRSDVAVSLKIGHMLSAIAFSVGFIWSRGEYEYFSQCNICLAHGSIV